MITLAPVSERKEIERLFTENSLTYTEFSGCVKASCGEDILGYSLYDLESDKMVIYIITPQDDLLFADGILRSTLHIAAERSVMNTFYDDNIENLCEKLTFIKNKEEKRLDIDKLFKSCCSCK